MIILRLTTAETFDKVMEPAYVCRSDVDWLNDKD